MFWMDDLAELVDGAVQVDPPASDLEGRFRPFGDPPRGLLHLGTGPGPTVQELARSGVPVVIVPGVRDFDDQRVHLQAAAPRLNAVVVEADSEAITHALSKVVTASRRPAIEEPHGTEGAAWIARDLTGSSHLKECKV